MSGDLAATLIVVGVIAASVTTVKVARIVADARIETAKHEVARCSRCDMDAEMFRMSDDGSRLDADQIAARRTAQGQRKLERR